MKDRKDRIFPAGRLLVVLSLALNGCVISDLFGKESNYNCFQDQKGATICNPIVTEELDEIPRREPERYSKPKSGSGSPVGGSDVSEPGSQPSGETDNANVFCILGEIIDGEVFLLNGNGDPSTDPKVVICGDDDPKKTIKVNEDENTLTHMGVSYYYSLGEDDTIVLGEKVGGGENNPPLEESGDDGFMPFDYSSP